MITTKQSGEHNEYMTLIIGGGENAAILFQISSLFVAFYLVKTIRAISGTRASTLIRPICVF